ncbi:PIN/TRAM domain-containing protein [Clostridium sp. MSJ-11]|uniref:PIN/TRAM domain-containing protein n=1 Tax=Clostridium mobile TaxID=2841512 RepID=A0ABS6EK05_9CLOT|nr:PIN/TRAM domain-containing protein [Clostridium mobile]MBU5485006.1 PIN/TRAM domain-containing protein [Clostridium mobile]
MLKKVLRGLFTTIGVTLGFIISSEMLNTELFSKLDYFQNSPLKSVLFISLSSILFGLILFLISPWITIFIMKVMDYAEKSIQKIPTHEILLAAFGAIIGLGISAIFVTLLSKIPIIGVVLAVGVALLMAALGANIALKKREDILALFTNLKKSGTPSKDKKSKLYKGDPKVLDTSVIIDGRIFDICQTGFVEGTLVIPNFVLEELRHIADSSDGLKRNRGRRGLDILNKIQKELNIEVQIYEKDFPDIAEVDSKLLKLAQVLNGKVITNDYNLNKVAEFQGVPVLNINELANAVKPVVLPGEEMRIQIVKDGKESGQGVAYLDDGTMIVVEGGRKSMGETIDVVVTSVLQTAAGRMIFARQKDGID